MFLESLFINHVKIENNDFACAWGPEEFDIFGSGCVLALIQQLADNEIVERKCTSLWETVIQAGFTISMYAAWCTKFKGKPLCYMNFAWRM